MSNPYVNPSKNSNNASGQQSSAQKQPTAVNVKRLQNELNNLYESLAGLRNNSSESQGNNGASYNPSNVTRESNYLSQIYAIQGELESATKTASVNGSVPGVENNNLSSDQTTSSNNQNHLSGASQGADSASAALSGAQGGFGDMFGDFGSYFSSMMDNFSNGFNSFADGIGSGFQKLGEAVSNASKWFVSQLKGVSNANEDGGSNNSNCGFACLEMIYRQHGKQGDAASADSDIEKDRQDIGLTDESQGATPEQLAAAARNRGFDAESMNGNMNDAIQQLNGGKNVILAVDPAKYKPGYQSGGHAIVLQSVDEASGTAVILDPAEQGPITVSLAALNEAVGAAGNRFISIGDPNQVYGNTATA